MAPGVSSCYYQEVPPSVSFSGSGFLATYQLGVAQCFLTHAPRILRTAPCVLGASAGSLVAAAVVCEMSLITIRDEMLHFARQMRSFTLGPFNPSVNVFHWLESVLHKHLPSDAHQLASGRLGVAVTRLTDRKLIIMSEFQSKEDVVQALLCSCFVPGYCGMLPPSFKGVHYVDGGFSCMQPLLSVPCSHILTVSPFSGEMDICPADTPSMWDMVVSGTTLKGNMANSLRILNALYPMSLETLGQAYESGYKDALDYLLNNGLIPYMLIQQTVDTNQTKTHLEMTGLQEEEEEEEMKVEKEAATLTSFNSTGQESTGNRSIEDLPVHFDLVKNALLGNAVTYLTMFGLPLRILSHLLLPLMLLFHTVLQNSHRLESSFRQAPVSAFWAWQGLRHFTLFFFQIVVSTIKKNINDRVMPVILLLQWLRVQTKYQAPPGQMSATPYSTSPSSSFHSEDVRRGHLHRWLNSLRDNKKP